MLTVWKYEVPITDEFELSIPNSAVILTTMVQHGKPVLYVLVDTEAPKVPHKFVLHGTGNPIDPSSAFTRCTQYVGSFKLYEDKLIFHLFRE